MAHGREVRLPFLSHELVAFIFSLPANFKIRNAWTKWLLREAVKTKLPDPIVWRKEKIGYEPMFDWRSEEFLTLANDAIQTLKQKNILNKSINIKNVFSKDEKLGWRVFNSSLLV